MSGTLSLTFNVTTAPFDVVLPIVEDPLDPITFTINWGDGNTDSSLSHTYATNASFTAVITITNGSVTAFGNTNWTGGEVLTAVDTSNNATWGLPGVTSLSFAFSGAVLLESVPAQVPSSVTNMANMFNGATLFNQNISGWNVSSVTNMNSMFDFASTFNQDISVWNVSSVTNMRSMFIFASAFNNGAVGNVGGKPLTWTTGTGTSLVTNMSNMFQYANAFNQDISSWNVSSVTNMSYMLANLGIFNNGSLTNDGLHPLTWSAGTGTSNVTDMQYLFGFTPFNQYIGGWNVSKVIYMNGMFQNSAFNNGSPTNDGLNPLTWSAGTGTSLVENMEVMFAASQFNQDISGWNVSNVTNMNIMFQSTSVFNQDISGWDVSKVIYMRTMFGSTGAFNQDISSWNVSSVTDMSDMFSSASQFNNGSLMDDGLHPLTWGNKTSNVTNMGGMFSSTIAFNQDISGWNVSSVTNMGFMLGFARKFNNGSPTNDGLHPLTWSAGTGTSLVENMGYMFWGTTTFNQNVNSWNVSKVTNMNRLFSGVGGGAVFNNGSITDDSANPITWGASTSNVTDMGLMFESQGNFNQDISSWNVSKVTSMTQMFTGCIIFNQDISSWDVSKVTDMSFMFSGANVFNQDISSWNVSKVTTMTNMFRTATAFNNGSATNDGLHPLTWTDPSGTSLVQNMSDMFHTATAFNQRITSWNVSSVQNMNQMFNNAPIFNNGSITNDGLNALTWGANTSNVTDMSAMFYNDFGSAFNQTITGWDVSKVTTMVNMFYGAAVFNNGSTTNDGLNALTWGVKTSNVTNMVQVFRGASAFNQDISGWDVSKVTDIQYMFLQAFAFNNGDTGNNGLKPLTWGTKTSNITNMASVFSGANHFNQDISSWNVSKVTTMTSMFRNSTIFNKNIRVWDVDSVTDFVDMFIGATDFQDAFYPTTPGYDVASGGPDTPTAAFFTGPPPSLSLTFNVTTSPFVVTLPIIGTSVTATIDWDDGTIDTGMVAPFTHVYATDASFTAVINITSDPSSVTQFGSSGWAGVGILTDVSTNSLTTWGLPGVTSFNQAFNGAILLESVPSDIPSNVTDLSYMFPGAEVFDQDISTWDVSHVTNMSSMFTDAYIFNNGGAALTWSAGTGTSNVTNMSGMFQGATLFNQDIGGWNVSNVTNMSGMFGRASVFNNGGVALDWTAGTGTSNVTNMSGMFQDAYLFDQAISTWDVSKVTNVQSMFQGASAFNQDISTWDVSKVENMVSMFRNTSAFNQNISTWDVSLVTNMSTMFINAEEFNNGGVALNWGAKTSNVQDMSLMFQDASKFNADITSWDVSSVTDMSNMFENAVLFNKNIRYWVVVSPTTLTNMFLGATAMTAKYTGTTGYGATPLYTFFNQVPYPCFLEDTQILCLENGKEVYRPVQSLRKGDLVKTIYNGYLPIHMIGTSPMYNPSNNDRIAARLYKCPKENYPGLLDDLYITGCHSILVPWLTYEQGQKTIASLGRLFVTDKHCRLMAWVDEKAVPYKMEGVYNIYHIALENEDYYMNYGIYANGLLVESCSKRYLMEMSNMRILGEEDCSLTEDVSVEENVLHKMPGLIETC